MTFAEFNRPRSQQQGGPVLYTAEDFRKKFGDCELVLYRCGHLGFPLAGVSPTFCNACLIQSYRLDYDPPVACY